MPTSRRRPAATIFAGVLVAAVLLPCVDASTAATPSRAGDDRGLGKHDRELIAEARASGKSTVQLIVAAVPGSSTQVDSAVKNLGGKVLYREDDIDYLRVSIGHRPGGARWRGSPVSARSTSTRSSRSTTRGRTAQTTPTPQTAARRRHPGGQPLHADRRHRRRRSSLSRPPDLGRPRHHRRHPRHRRRPRPPGAHDHHHRRAQDRRLGHLRPHPTGDDDPTWVNMSTQVSGPSFTSGRRRRTPRRRRRTYRFGAVQRARPAPRRRGRQRRQPRRQPGRQQRAVRRALEHRRPTTCGSTPTRTDSFADEPAMTDYKVALRRRLLRHRQPGDRRRASGCRSSSRPTRKNKFVNIGIVSGAARHARRRHRRGQRHVRRRDERRARPAPRSSRCGSACSSPAARPTP